MFMVTIKRINVYLCKGLRISDFVAFRPASSFISHRGGSQQEWSREVARWFRGGLAVSGPLVEEKKPTRRASEGIAAIYLTHAPGS